MKITFDKKNYRKHSEQNKKRIRKSLTECGAGRSVLVDKDGCLIAGNGVFEQAEKMGIKTRVVETDGTELVVVKRTDIGTDDPKRKTLALADNATSDNVEWDVENIAADFEVEDLSDWGISVDFAVDESGGVSEKHGNLCERFVVPPFSVLDARQGYWKERKKQWRELIGDNGESRQKTLAKDSIMAEINNGVSLLDPVLAEVICKWFCIEGGTSFDTFAGDSVFGYVAAKLGNTFTGIELRQEQADLNNERVQGMSAKYICDDGQNILEHIGVGTQDLFFSCPPYFDLEVYSDKENDASNQDTYEDFMRIIENAFTGAIKCLKDDRFAVVVCGDIRDKKGAYYGFPDDIKRVFVNNGCVLYNELILVDPIGSAMLRCARSMRNRKVAKVHQNVLVFYKGNLKNIKNNYKAIEYAGEDLEQFGLDESN